MWHILPHFYYLRPDFAKINQTLSVFTIFEARSGTSRPSCTWDFWRFLNYFWPSESCGHSCRVDTYPVVTSESLRALPSVVCLLLHYYTRYPASLLSSASVCFHTASTSLSACPSALRSLLILCQTGICVRFGTYTSMNLILSQYFCAGITRLNYTCMQRQATFSIILAPKP